MEDQSLDGSSGGMAEKFAPLLEGLKKFGIGKLLLIIIILGAAAWIFALAPQPTDLTVNVNEQDGGSLDDVEVTLVAPNVLFGIQMPGEKNLPWDGSLPATFKNVPTELPIRIAVEALDQKHESDTKKPTLKAKQTEIEITLNRRADLMITLETQKIQLGAGCTTSVPVTVRNNGKQAFEAELVGDSSLKDRIKATAVSIASEAEEKIAVNVTAPSEKGKPAAGKIRAKYTSKSASFTVEVTAPEEMKVSPDNYDGREAPNTQVKQLFTITNDGREGEIRDLTASIAGDAATFESVQTTFADSQPIKPGGTNTLTLSFTSPQPGKYVGVLIIKSACKSFQIPLELEVEAPRE